MNPCAFTWEDLPKPYTPDISPEDPSKFHVCVLEKNHKGDHTAVDGERTPNMGEVEFIVENLPMYVNLAEVGVLHGFQSHIGWAKVIRTAEGQNKIEILLDKQTSELLGNMVEVFDLKAVGFAGIKRLRHERES